MISKKEKIIEKILKKDYNNDLEEILAKKSFSEEVKNLLLDMLYKIEMSYKDYETVKKNVLPKDKYIENIIQSIKNNCNFIELERIDDESKETFVIDKKEKQIVCFPMTTKLLYAIAKIQKSEDIIKEEPDFLNSAISNTLNIGNSINMVEPLRDFNGYAWSIGVSDIDNFYYNLIYQDLIILSGNVLLEEWINKNDAMIDYFELFKDNLEKEYGEKFQIDIIEIIKNLAMLIEIKLDKDFAEKIKFQRKNVKSELSDMKNMQTYLEKLTSLKKQISNNIKKIDIVLNDEEKLTEEYINRNKKLPLEQKIFSKRILKEKIKEERKALLDKLKTTSEKMNAKTFSQRKERLEYELQYLRLIEVENIDKEISDGIILLQKRVMQAIKIKIKHTTTKEDLNKILYEIRYLKSIPVKDKKVGKLTKLNNMFITLEKNAIEKAYELRDFNEISKYKEIDFEILKNIFDLDIIKLEDISLKLLHEKTGNYVQFYDDNIADEKIKLESELEKEDLRIKIGKKIKLFTI